MRVTCFEPSARTDGRGAGNDENVIVVRHGARVVRRPAAAGDDGA